MTKRLSDLKDVAPGAVTPGYDPGAHGVGILHIGTGAFFRAHLAAYTDDALAASGGDWRIAAVNLRSDSAERMLAPQNGLYTLLQRGPDGATARVIGSIARVHTGAGALAEIADPRIRIVSLTVTEEAYDAQLGKALADALARRRAENGGPVTLLSCDNLPANGQVLRKIVTGNAPADLAAWIDANVAFPSTMVDRITPAATPETLAEAARLIGCEDAAAIETEPFRQWVIEDDFRAGCPDWARAGALLVQDISKYELMKLRMLNGSHTMVALLGLATGATYVRDVMAAPDLARLVDLHMRAAQSTLGEVPGIDLDSYRADLLARFANPGIAHRVRQIATDTSQKLPQRILEPAAELVARGGDVSTFALCAALWIDLWRRGTPPDDPLAEVIRDRLKGGDDPVLAMMTLPRLEAKALADDAGWMEAVRDALRQLQDDGAAATAKDFPSGSQ